MDCTGGGGEEIRLSWYNKEFIGEELTDFPVLVRLNDTITDAARDDLHDLVFTDSDGITKLAHDIEERNAIWVKVPTLLPTEDAILYLYYGNPSVAEDQVNPQEVWTNGYAGVWHLGDNPEGTIADTSENRNNGTTAGGMERGLAIQEGKVGSALQLDGNNDYISLPNVGSLKPTSAITVSAWINTRSPATQQMIFDNMTSSPYYGYELQLHANKVLWSPYTTTRLDLYGTTLLSADRWYHVVAIYDGSKSSVYLNGIEEASASQSGNIDYTSTVTPAIGARYHGATLFVNGFLDDIRVDTRAHSSAWIATEYANQCDCEDFLTISTTIESQTPSSSLSGGTTATVMLKSDRPLSFSSLASFIVNAGGGAAPVFQLSNDGGTTWLFYYGGSPSTSSTGSEQAGSGHPAAAGWKSADLNNPRHRSSAADINGHVATFPTGDGTLLWKAYLPSGTSLDQIHVGYMPGVATGGVVSEVAASPSSFPVTVQKLNDLYQTAFDREPTFSEWTIWATRMLKETKPLDAWLGAMEWAARN